MFLAALLLLPLLDTPGPSGPGFGPRKVLSSNGWELSIRPFNSDGLHGAEYSLLTPLEERPARELRVNCPPGPYARRVSWQGSRFWTLRDPIVSERGWTYGCALVNHSSATVREPDTSWVVAIDADGKTRIEVKLPTSREGGPFRGVVPMEEFETLVVRAAPRDPTFVFEELWFYDLKTGTRGATCIPFAEETAPPAYTERLSVAIVKGVPLVLVHGMRQQPDLTHKPITLTANDRWAVFDLAGKQVWNLDDSIDPQIKNLGDWNRDVELRRQTIASSKPSEFEITIMRTKERVVYATSLDPKTKTWVVTEKSREPLKLEQQKK